MLFHLGSAVQHFIVKGFHGNTGRFLRFPLFFERYDLLVRGCGQEVHAIIQPQNRFGWFLHDLNE